MAAKSEIPTTSSFLRLPDVKKRVGLSRSSIYARVASGDFPAPVSLGGRSIAWIDFEIQDWIDQRVAAARGGAK